MGDFHTFILPSTAFLACNISDIQSYTGSAPRDDLAVPLFTSSVTPLVRTVCDSLSLPFFFFINIFYLFYLFYRA